MRFRFLFYLAWIGIGVGLIGLFGSVAADVNGAHDALFSIRLAVSVAVLFLGAILRAVLAIEENTRRT